MSNEIVICPSCGSANRVPSDRLAAHARCGRCKAPLFAGKPLAADSVMFGKLVGKGSLPVLVDFWAAWCGPCRMMAPAFEAAASRLEPEIVLAKVDTEKAQDVAERYGIRSIPTLILFRGGREIARHSGAMNENGIIQWTRSALQ